MRHPSGSLWSFARNPPRQLLAQTRLVERVVTEKICTAPRRCGFSTACGECFRFVFAHKVIDSTVRSIKRNALRVSCARAAHGPMPKNSIVETNRKAEWRAGSSCHGRLPPGMRKSGRTRKLRLSASPRLPLCGIFCETCSKARSRYDHPKSRQRARASRFPL